METQFIGVQREMRRWGRSVGAFARSSAAYAEYNNIIFRFWESAADYELSLETAGERRLSLAPTFCSEARSGCRPLGPRPADLLHLTRWKWRHTSAVRAERWAQPWNGAPSDCYSVQMHHFSLLSCKPTNYRSDSVVWFQSESNIYLQWGQRGKRFHWKPSF